MKAIVFWEPDFPFVDTPTLTRSAIEAGLAPAYQVKFVDAAGLPRALEAWPAVFVSPYGSTFPKNMWTAFKHYLEGGGNWVNLGGAPVSRPASYVNGEWRVEREQRAYGKEIFIKQAFPIELPADARYAPPARVVSIAGLSMAPENGESIADMVSDHGVRRAWALQVGFAETDSPVDSGAPSRSPVDPGAPSRTAEIRPIVTASVDGRHVVAPVTTIDRLKSGYVKGRWVLASFDAETPVSPELIRALCDIATLPPVQLTIQPSYACYYPRERASVEIDLHAPALNEVDITVTVLRESKPFYLERVKARSGKLTLALPDPVAAPGLYTVSAIAADAYGRTVASSTNGFWGYDADLLSSPSPVTVDHDYFIRDGNTLPITGTTYMGADTHRNCFFEPNPHVWEYDFALMAAAGVNWVRTGFWKGWERAMPGVGRFDERVFRAINAFLHTAARHDIPVTFTFFAFIPPLWGGENPYLDDVSVRTQEEFVKAIAGRFAHVSTVSWDLINEPSFSSPDRVWMTRPNYDDVERAVWANWLRGHGVADDEWRARWGITPATPLDLPDLSEFDAGEIATAVPSVRVHDYFRFAQEQFRLWAERLASAIRGNGNPQHLVTVGQDEGGTEVRPGPHFYGPAVDFTSNHSWWQNDSLLWDSIITKTPSCPHLVQETGIMFVERLDGRFRRTPDEARNLLEHKMALSFAGGCAGFIQWLWNTNHYLDSDNETAIGFWRSDGSDKPELAAFRGVADFFARNRERITGRVPEDVCLIIPHSNIFSARNLADIATRRSIRVLEYHLGVACRAVSEYRAHEAASASTIILPSPRVLTDHAWETLLAHVSGGARLLITGIVDADEYWRDIPRLAEFGLATETKLVARSETIDIGDDRVEIAFADARGFIERAVVNDNLGASWHSIKHGFGEIIYCPIPVELSISEAETAAVYRAVVGQRPIVTGLLVREVKFKDASLWIFVNERSTDAVYTNGELSITVPTGRIAFAFVDAVGTLLDKYVPR